MQDSRKRTQFRTIRHPHVPENSETTRTLRFLDRTSYAKRHFLGIGLLLATSALWRGLLGGLLSTLFGGLLGYTALGCGLLCLPAAGAALRGGLLGGSALWCHSRTTSQKHAIHSTTS